MILPATIYTGKPHGKVKVNFNIAQHPVLGIAQGTLHFTPWQTCSIGHYLNFSLKNPAMLQLINAQRLFVHKYPPLSITSYFFIQLSELQQCRVNKTCPRFNTEFEPKQCLLLVETLPSKWWEIERKEMHYYKIAACKYVYCKK